MKFTYVYLLASVTIGFITCGCNNVSIDQPIDESKPKVVFMSDRDGDHEIFSMDINGANVIQLTSNDKYDANPSISPAMQKIVFNSDRYGSDDLFTMDVNGSYQTSLTSDKESVGCSWSPDGNRIVYISWINNGEIYIIDSDGKNNKQLTTTNDTTENNLFPMFSPNGQKLIYTLMKTINNDSDAFYIMMMNADGTNKQQLTTRGDDLFPVFTPDGQNLVFMSWRDGDDEIYIMNLDGSGQRAITNNNFDDNIPRFIPGSDRIFFSSNRDGDRDIYSMKIDGTDVQQLTDSPGTDTFLGDDNGSKNYSKLFESINKLH